MMSTRLMLWLVTLCVMMQPISTDLNLPALPTMADYFAVNVGLIQNTVTAFIIGFGFAQILAGPLADRYGRRPVMLAGAVVFGLGSVLCSVSLSLDMMFYSRVLSGCGACMGLVAARAMVRDTHNTEDGVRMISKAGTLMGIVPLLAPITGATLNSLFGWRMTFVPHSLLALALFAVAWRYLQETAPAVRTPLSPRAIWHSYTVVAKSRVFWGFSLAASMAYGALFAHLSGSSTVFVKVLGKSPEFFAICFSLCVGGYVTGTIVLRRILPRVGMAGALRWSGAIMLSTMCISTAIVLSGTTHWLSLLIPQFIFQIGYGFVISTCQSGSVAPFPERAGAASSLMGVIQMLGAIVVGYTLSRSFNGTAMPLLLCMLVCSVLFNAVVWSILRPAARS